MSVAQILAAASTAISHSTARGATSHPATPAAMAVNTLPAWSNASFRPIRRVNILGPTMPSEMAAIADGNTASALPMAACAAAISQKFGKNDIAIAPTATAMADTTINPRFQCVQSISAPNGVRAATVATPAIIMTTPIFPGSQCWLENR